MLEVFESDRDQLVPLTNLIVSRIFHALMRVATAQPNGRLPRPTSLTLDELGSAVGELPNFETRLSTLRSRGVSITGAVQQLSQLENLYGKAADAIVGNFNTKIFFGGGLGLGDARYASELSGTMTAGSISTSDVENDGVVLRSESCTPVGRRVLLPEEISRPRVHPLLGPPASVFFPDVPPFYAYFTPAYEIPEIAWAMREPSETNSSKTSSAVADDPPEDRIPPVDKPGGEAFDDSGVSDERKRIARLKRRLGCNRLSGDLRRWWKQQEKQFRDRPAELRRQLEQLVCCQEMRKRLPAPQARLFEQLRCVPERSGTQDFAANIAFLYWSLAVQLEVAREIREKRGK